MEDTTAYVSPVPRIQSRTAAGKHAIRVVGSVSAMRSGSTAHINQTRKKTSGQMDRSLSGNHTWECHKWQQLSQARQALHQSQHASHQNERHGSGTNGGKSNICGSHLHASCTRGARWRRAPSSRTMNACSSGGSPLHKEPHGCMRACWDAAPQSTEDQHHQGRACPNVAATPRGKRAPAWHSLADAKRAPGAHEELLRAP